MPETTTTSNVKCRDCGTVAAVDGSRCIEHHPRWYKAEARFVWCVNGGLPAIPVYCSPVPAPEPTPEPHPRHCSTCRTALATHVQFLPAGHDGGTEGGAVDSCEGCAIDANETFRAYGLPHGYCVSPWAGRCLACSGPCEPGTSLCPCANHPDA